MSERRATGCQVQCVKNGFMLILEGHPYGSYAFETFGAMVDWMRENLEGVHVAEQPVIPNGPLVRAWDEGCEMGHPDYWASPQPLESVLKNNPYASGRKR